MINFKLIINHTLFRLLLVFILSYSFFSLLNINHLNDWSLSGDDLHSLTNAVPNLQSLFYSLLYNFSGQYRYLTYFLFGFYKIFLPDFLHIFLLHGVLFSLIPTLLYLVLGHIVKGFPRLALLLPIFFTPIFYYHTYTISSLANILMCIVTLLLLFYFQRRDVLHSWKFSLLFFSILVLSFAIKETFVLPLTIFCFTQLLNIRRNKYYSILFISLSVLIFGLYVFNRVNAYSFAIPSDYYFNFHFGQAATNLSNMFAWIIQYPRGWQYGAPIRYNLWHICISVSSLLLILISVCCTFLRNKLELVSLLLFGFASVSIFIFLNITHVFYMDLPFLLLIILFAHAYAFITTKQRKFAQFFLFSLLIVSATNLIFIKPQWLQYSFVANANTSAKNYKKILEENNYKKYSQICIVDHNRGEFGTENGNLVNHLKTGLFTIISTKEKTLPSECNTEDSLNLLNDAWEYYVYDATSSASKTEI